MKRTLATALALISLIAVFTFPVSAADDEFGLDEIWEQTEERTKEYLEELGIDSISFDELFDLSPVRVIKFLAKIAMGAGTDIFKDITLIVVILIICAIALSFLRDSDRLERIIYFISTLLIISAVIVPISRVMTDAASGIKLSAVFINSYLPVMAAVIIASQNPALAMTYNSFSIFLSTVIANFADKFFVPIISSLLALNILSSFSLEGYREKLIKTVQKVVIVLLSLFSTVFTGLLTTQSILATSSDSLTMKGIKFISGTFVPVVGSGVGDALSSVFSSFLIMRNTLGVFVIAVILIINLPVITELLLWYFALEFCSIVASMFNLNCLTEIIDNLASVISLINIVVFFVTFVLVISTGVIIVIGK